MTLNDYLNHLTGDDKMTDAEFGAKIGLSQSQISRLRRGAKPSYETIDAILAATNGAVTPNDWFPLLPERLANGDVAEAAE